MKAFRYTVMLWLLMGLSITASNQDSRHLESLNEGVFMVKAVFVDSDGVKWFGTNRGLCRYTDLTWRYYTDVDHLAGNRVNALVFEETEGGPGLWVATTEGVSLVYFDANGVTGSAVYTTEDGILNDDVSDVAVDSRHGRFFGSSDGITWFHDGIMDSLIFSKYYNYMMNSPVRQMDIYNDTLYIAQDGGIGRFVSGVDGVTGASRWSNEYGITPFSGNIRSVKVSGMDKQWFGTDVGVETHTGYFAKTNWGLYSTDSGLVQNDVISIAEDESGGMWFGTHGGVSHLKDGIWTSYTTAEGLLNDTVYDIAFDPDGSVWFATGAGACRLLNETFQDFITAVTEVKVSEMEFRVHYNRASGSIHLFYHLDESGSVSARLYSMDGMLVGQWNNIPSLPGEHRMELPLTASGRGGLPGGIYVVQLIQRGRTGSEKLIITH